MSRMTLVGSAWLKKKYRLSVLGAREEMKNSAYSKAVSKLPEITIRRSPSGGFLTTDGRTMTIGNDPETALRNFLIRRKAQTDLTVLKKLYRQAIAPAVEILEFRAKSDLDGMRHYVVDFLTNIDLNRGDMESTLSIMVQQAGLGAVLTDEQQLDGMDAGDDEELKSAT